MSQLVQYFWPAGVNDPGHAVSIVPVSNGLMLPRVHAPVTYMLNPSGGSYVVSPDPVLTVSGMVGGFIDACPDGTVSGAWLLGAYGDITHAVSGTGDIAYPITGAVSGDTFVAAAYVPGRGLPYFVADNGDMASVVSGAVVQTTGWGEAVATMAADTTKLYAILPGSDRMGAFTFTGNTTGTVVKSAIPLNDSAVIAALGTTVAIGGWTEASLALGATCLQGNPAAAFAAAATPGTNRITLISGTEPDWSVVNFIGGSGAPQFLAWTPNGQQLLVTDATNSQVSVYNLVFGQLQFAQSFILSGAGRIAITHDGLTAVVASSSTGFLTFLTNTVGVWSVAQQLNIGAAGGVWCESDGDVIAGMTGGVQWLQFLSGAWTRVTQVSGLGFNPVDVFTDQDIIYATGGVGTGWLAAVTESGILASTSWAGNARDVFYERNQICVADDANNLIRIFSRSAVASSFTQQRTITAPAGCTFIGNTGPSVWLCGSSSLVQDVFTSPFNLVPQRLGAVTFWNGSSFSTTTLRIGRLPSALAWDTFNSLWATTLQNDLYQFTASGAQISHTDLVPNSQTPTGLAPSLGIAAMLWWQNGLWGVSALTEAALQLTTVSAPLTLTTTIPVVATVRADTRVLNPFGRATIPVVGTVRVDTTVVPAHTGGATLAPVATVSASALVYRKGLANFAGVATVSLAARAILQGRSNIFPIATVQANATITPAAGSTAPSTPTVTASSVTASSLTLNWPGVTGTAPILYDVQWRISGQPTYQPLTSGLSATTYGVSNLNPNVIYQFQVTARNNVGSATSAAANATTVNESPNNTTLTTTTGSITDATGASWTWTTGGVVNRNGSPVGFTSGVTQITYWNHTVYNNSPSGWSYWNGLAWVATANPIGESAQGTTVINTSQIIVDGTGSWWTLYNSVSGGYQVQQNGTVDTGTSSVTLLLYWNHQVYQQNSTGSWYVYGGTPGSWPAVAGDPRTTPVFSDIFTTSQSWLAHATWQTNDQFAYVANSSPAGMSDGFATWWANGVSTPATISLYQQVYNPNQYGLQIGLMANPGGLGITQSRIGTRFNNQNLPGGNQRLYGFYEFSVQVQQVPGFLFGWSLTDQLSGVAGSTWTAQLDILIWTDVQNVQHVQFRDAYAAFVAGNIAGAGVIYETTTVNASVNHIYAVDVQSDFIRFFIDHVQIASYANPGGDYKLRPMISYFFTSDASYIGGILSATSSLPAYATLGYYNIYPSQPGVVSIAQITGIQMSNTVVPINAPVATLVGTASVGMTTGTFTGSLTIGPGTSTYTTTGGGPVVNPLFNDNFGSFNSAKWYYNQFDDGGDAWWTYDPALTPLVYVYTGGHLDLLLRSTPAGHPEITKPYISGIQDTANAGSSFTKQYGYWEISVAVDRLAGLIFGVANLSPYNWPPSLELFIWTDSTGKQFVLQDIAGYPAISAQTDSASGWDARQQHTYGVLWTATVVRFYRDRVLVGDFANPGNEYTNGDPLYSKMYCNTNIYPTDTTILSPGSLPQGAHIYNFAVYPDLPFGSGSTVTQPVFSMSGANNVVTATPLAQGAYNLVLVAAQTGVSNSPFTSPNIQINVQASSLLPPQVTGLALVGTASSSAVVAWLAPRPGGVMDAGRYQVQWSTTGGNWTDNGPVMTYCTPGFGSVQDTFGNVWTLNSAGHPVVNGLVDTPSSCQWLLFDESGVIWQFDTIGEYWTYAGTGVISGSFQNTWNGAFTVGPFDNVTISGLASNQSYTARVYATNSVGSGPPSTTVPFSTGTVAQQQITNITLSNQTIAPNLPIGTLVGTATVAMSSGTFTGSLAVVAGTSTTTITGGGSSVPVPAQAAAVGYNMLTFGPTINLNNWTKLDDEPVTVNGDGSITLGPGNGSFASYQTVSTLGSDNFTGACFGGGLYLEAEISVSNSIVSGGGWPAWWSNDIDGQRAYRGSTYYQAQCAWPGRPGQYVWFEPDYMECNQDGIAGGAVHVWYNGGTLGDGNNPDAWLSGGATNRASIDMTQRNKFGFLWVPATQGVANSGRMEMWYNGAIARDTSGRQMAFRYNYWGDAGTTGVFPPNITSAMGGMDNRHLYLIIGAGQNSMRFYSISVWQKDNSKNFNVTPPPGGTTTVNNFAISGSANIVTNVAMPVGTYSLVLRATQAGIVNSPYTNPAPISISVTTVTNPPGPAASSSFLTADFTSAMNYPLGGPGQQVVSQRLYGASGGGFANNNWAVFTNTTYRTLASTINYGLMYFKNSSGTSYWNADGTVNTAAFTNLINNLPAIDPLGISGVILGADWSGTNAAPGANGNPSVFGNRMAAVATYLNGVTMPGGRKFPLVGFIGQDEPNSSFNADPTVTGPYYNAMATAVKAVSPSFLIAGPNTDSMLQNWMAYFTSSSVPNLDVLSYDCFAGNGVASDPNDSAWRGKTYAGGGYRYAGDAQFASQNMGRNPTALLLGGYNIGDGTEACCMSHQGAVFQAYSLIQMLNNSKVQCWACMWDGWGDGAYGIITDPTYQGSVYGVTSQMQITPRGYFMAQGVRHVYGPRFNVTANSSGMLTCAVKPTSTTFGLLVVNSGQGNQSGQVALSHWPINGSGTGTASVWQLTASQNAPGMDGTLSTVNVLNGLTGSITFPDPSVTIIFI
jgi:hypothetical protein